MKVDVGQVILDDDGVKMTRLVKDGSKPDVFPTKEDPTAGMKRVPLTLGALMRDALNSDAFQKEKKSDDLRRIEFVCKIIRRGGDVEMKRPGWELVLQACTAAEYRSLFYTQIRDAIYPSEVFADDSIVDPPPKPKAKPPGAQGP